MKRDRVTVKQATAAARALSKEHRDGEPLKIEKTYSVDRRRGVHVTLNDTRSITLSALTIDRLIKGMPAT